MGAPKLNTANPLLDKELIQAFIDGVTETLSTMAMTKAQPQKPKIEKGTHNQAEISGLIGMVAGPLKGTMIIGFSGQAACSILEQMLGESYPEVNEEVADAVGELTNMIYGVAKKTLNEKGYNFEMAIPSVIRGKVDIVTASAAPSLVVPFLLENGSSLFIKLTVSSE
jgi:chemotaxis protein CheX